MGIKINKKLPYRTDFENIEVGDVAYDECGPMGTGGYTYNSGDKVIDVTDTEIQCIDSYNGQIKYFDRLTLDAIKTQQTAYYLHGYQKIK